MKTRSLITPAEPKGRWWGKDTGAVVEKGEETTGRWWGNDAIELRRCDGGGRSLTFHERKFEESGRYVGDIGEL